VGNIQQTVEVIQTCREEVELEDGGRCGARAEFLLWGKLFPKEALGPRCYDHAVKWTHHSLPTKVDQWAVLDLRGLRRVV
jgi:hypothetical protein